jgi:hypothetical protein
MYKSSAFVDSTNIAVLSAVMNGAYLFDLAIYRNDFLGTVHHLFGPVLLIWMRSSHSTFTPSDALVCRPLIMFVLFGASLSGTASSVAIFLLRIGKRYLKQETLYNSFAACLATLTLSTVLSCFINISYFHHVYQEAFARFSVSLLLPASWEAFECYLQWRWLFIFYSFEARFVAKPQTTQPSSIDGTILKRTSKTDDAHPPRRRHLTSLFPAATVTVLKVLAMVWTVLCAALFARIACEAVPQLAGGRGEALLVSALDRILDKLRHLDILESWLVKL